MPHTKNKPRTSSKKKKTTSTGSQAVDSWDARTETVPATDASSKSSYRRGMSSHAHMNNFSFRECDASPRSPSSLLDEASDSIYVRYKKSTERFKDALQSMVPSDIFQSNNLNALMNAVDYIAEHGLDVERSVLDDLKLTIRVRKCIASTKFNGGDSGHSFFIAVLIYCWSVLAPLQKGKSLKRMQAIPSSTPVPPEHLNNRFASLAFDDEDGENDPEDDLPSKPVPRPEEKQPTRLSLQELIHATDRTDCAVFLMTLDELMRFNSIQFSKLKNRSEWAQQLNHPPSTVIEQMMETAVCTNAAIQQVTALEQRFNHDHPHINTVYRFLARLIFSQDIENLTDVVSKGSPLAAEFTEKQAVEFLGDTLECSFRNRSDPNNKMGSLVTDFVERWRISDKDSVQRIYDLMFLSVKLEVPSHQESCMRKQFMQLAKDSGCLVPSHSWLNLPYIGENRSIIHTIRLLQGLSNVIVGTHGRLELKEGFFGISWENTCKRKISRIQVEMDELLMGDIMPPLINLCYEGFLSNDLPYQEELLSLFCQIKSLVKHPERPVSWSLAFAVHSILTSIFEVQGSNHLTFLGDAARQAFDLFVTQLDWADKTRVQNMPRLPSAYEANMKMLRSLRFLVESPMKYHMSERKWNRGVWNPLGAGTILSFIAYFGNLEGGVTMVDAVSQLRVIMHLYNALLQSEVIKTGDIELLDFLYKCFHDCKAVWEGPIPIQGQFQVRWWISFGMKIEEAQRLSTQAKERNFQNASSVRNYYGKCRKLTPIQSESLSKSYRRICLQDFHDVVDIYHNEKQRQKMKDTDVYKHAVCVNDSLDAMEADERLLATNLISIGTYLNQFFVSLLNVLGFMPIVDMIVQTTPDDVRFSRRMDGRSVRSSESWEVSDENLKYQAMAHIMADRLLRPLDLGERDVAWLCAEFMGEYFKRVPPENVMWFTPVEYQEEEK